MKKYRKRPVVIEAVQCKEPTTPDQIVEWCGSGTRKCGVGDLSAKQWIEVETLEGTMIANYGDWIIKGVSNEFYPCKPDIFEKIYKEIDEELTPVEKYGVDIGSWEFENL